MFAPATGHKTLFSFAATARRLRPGLIRRPSGARFRHLVESLWTDDGKAGARSERPVKTEGRAVTRYGCHQFGGETT